MWQWTCCDVDSEQKDDASDGEAEPEHNEPVDNDNEELPEEVCSR